MTQENPNSYFPNNPPHTKIRIVTQGSMDRNNYSCEFLSTVGAFIINLFTTVTVFGSKNDLNSIFWKIASHKYPQTTANWVLMDLY